MGIDKARELAMQPAIKELDVLYSSLQTKAIETMVYLAKPNIIPMRIHSGLTEITSFTNEFEANEERYMRQIKQYYNGQIDRIANGETIDEALDRFMSALETVVNQEHAAKNIGIVTHGYILSFFTGKYSHLSPFDLHHSIQQPDIAEFDWDSKSFTKLWNE